MKNKFTLLKQIHFDNGVLYVFIEEEIGKGLGLKHKLLIDIKRFLMPYIDTETLIISIINSELKLHLDSLHNKIQCNDFDLSFKEKYIDNIIKIVNLIKDNYQKTTELSKELSNEKD